MRSVLSVLLVFLASAATAVASPAISGGRIFLATRRAIVRDFGRYS
jgi:hypothetical protein